MDVREENVNDKWKQYIITNDNDMEVHILNFGGSVTKILVPDKNGKLENVVLGYKDSQDYETNPNFFGSIIGRVAGRISGARFELDDESYELEASDGKNSLHSGSNGFHQVIWDVEPFELNDEIGVKLSYLSKDGESGFPGNVKVDVIYSLNNNNQLTLEYSATSDKTTALTLTNHSYFNLTGNMKDTIHSHHVTMNSPQFVELDKDLIATGNILAANGTAFDFKQGRFLKDGLNEETEQNRIAGNGYDHYFIFDEDLGKVEVREEVSGRKLTIQTNQPGMVMYTANNLDESLDLAEGTPKKYLGVCFETQSSPASLHHNGFPTVRLSEGEVYKRQTVYTFSVEAE